MKKILILFCFFNSIFIELICQITVEENLLTIGAKCTSSKIRLDMELNIQHVIFDGSKLKEIDSTWLVLKNIKSITFLNNAVIPRNLSLVNYSYNLGFKAYEKTIKFPSDFPFDKVKEVSFIYVSEIPSGIGAFKDADFFEFYSIKDKKLSQKISVLNSVKHLRLSEVPNFNFESLCSMKELENLELTQLTFSSDIVDLRCASKLITVFITDTNMKKLYLSSKNLMSITLEGNLLSAEEIVRIDQELIFPKKKIKR